MADKSELGWRCPGEARSKRGGTQDVQSEREEATRDSPHRLQEGWGGSVHRLRPGGAGGLRAHPRRWREGTAVAASPGWWSAMTEILKLNVEGPELVPQNKL